MTNLDSIFKSRDITLPTKVGLVKAMVFPVLPQTRGSRPPAPPPSDPGVRTPIPFSLRPRSLYCLLSNPLPTLSPQDLGIKSLPLPF